MVSKEFILETLLISCVLVVFYLATLSASTSTQLYLLCFVGGLAAALFIYLRICERQSKAKQESRVNSLKQELVKLGDSLALYTTSQNRIYELERKADSASMAAHDIRNLIVSLRKKLEEISSMKGLGEQQIQAASTAMRLQLEQLEKLNSELQAISGKSERTTGELRNIEISDIFELAIWGLHSKPLRVDIVDHLALYGEQSQLVRLVRNLVSNALDAARTQVALSAREVTITQSKAVFLGILPTGTYCRITVSDDGEGIPPDLLPNIFAPFVSSKGKKGTGLGLTIVARVLRTYHGALDIETNASGTSIHVFLPLDSAGSQDTLKVVFEPNAKFEQETLQWEKYDGEEVLFVAEKKDLVSLLDAPQSIIIACNASNDDTLLEKLFLPLLSIRPDVRLVSLVSEKCMEEVDRYGMSEQLQCFSNQNNTWPEILEHLRAA